jgi:glycosyltransferase involved in cell wall biosynthesis
MVAKSVDPLPDVVVVASWGLPTYVKAATALPKSVLRVVASDSPWRRSPKQLVGQITHRGHLGRAFDGAWVTGLPQRELMRRLGFSSNQIIEHMYCADTNLFAPTATPKERYDAVAPFLFVGRLVEHKGLVPLGQAFQRFRAQTGSSRRLRIVGSGGLDVAGDGVEAVPFVEPPEARDLMDSSYALIHPAFLEHWGLIVHEAASMGLPLVLSPAVGAATRFLAHGINGYTVDPDVTRLAEAMTRLDRLDLAAYERMSAASRQLGQMLTVDTWVENFENGVARLKEASGRG